MFAGWRPLSSVSAGQSVRRALGPTEGGRRVGRAGSAPDAVFAARRVPYGAAPLCLRPRGGGGGGGGGDVPRLFADFIPNLGYLRASMALTSVVFGSHQCTARGGGRGL
ncbi:hypothetical protein CALCODRAFT_268836 [Calocera cornea HHB12733]|uniref:Uncharacterized protein n=1 Tax=Calocera cornea HHB12733 TaxID=1353952 RepID=A0A166JMC0_9BASI|nr:hypothetical protein CALCODRAFT_268836 [Calocera cornea HHB12733]